MQEIEYEDGRRETRLFNATKMEALIAHEQAASEPGVVKVTTQPRPAFLASQQSVGAALLAAEALRMPQAVTMRRSLVTAGNRIDNGRCRSCNKKPYDCRCQKQPQGA